MKHTLLTLTAIAAISALPFTAKAQAPSLGTAADFVLFTSVGAVGNTGITHLTGHVGSNSGSSTGFGNVDGTMHNNNGTTGTASADLLTAYNLLNASVATQFPAPLLGNGQVLTAGIYAISGNSTLSNTLTLNGQNNANAVFIIKINGSFSAGAGSKVLLTNGALACNVFWTVEGLVSMASGTEMKGNVIANNAAITIGSGSKLEGRALSTSGAVSVSNTKAFTPTGCGSTQLTGPASPTLGAAACFALFSGNGPASNSGDTYANGDVGTNVGLTTGFNALFINGTIHAIPDGTTAVCDADLLSAYNQLNALTADIELLYPAQFGKSLVLTPHTYVMNGAATLIDTVFLDARNNPSAVFVILVNGALSTGTYAKVKLINGAVAANVYWKIEGALNVDDHSQFIGTIICNNGAIDFGTGATLNGRALTTNGALATTAVTVTMPASCATSTTAVAPKIISASGSKSVCAGSSVNFTVTATGTALTYQWRKGAANLVNGGNVSGATSRTLTISQAATPDASSNYHVVVSGSAAPGATSTPASLEVIACGPVGISEADAPVSSFFYPNPFSGVLHLRLAGASVLNSSLVSVYTVLGNKVLETRITAEETTIKNQFSAGFYYYSIVRADGSTFSGMLIAE